MLSFDELRVLSALGDDIKRRNDKNKIFKCIKFKFNMLTIPLPNTTLINVLKNLKSYGFIEYKETYLDLDNCNLKISKNGFHEYLKHSGGLMLIYSQVASSIKNGFYNESDIAERIGQVEVVISTILEEWEDLGYIKLSKTENITNIQSITDTGERFINTLIIMN